MSEGEAGYLFGQIIVIGIIAVIVILAIRGTIKKELGKQDKKKKGKEQ